VDIQPPGAQSAVWRAFRDGDLIAYGFTLMVFLDRLEALPEPLGAAHDFGVHPPARHLSARLPAVPRATGRPARGTLNPLRLHPFWARRRGVPGARCAAWSAGVRLRSPAGSRPAASRRRPAAGQARCAAQGA
jgi:hypothetical protein